MLENVKQNFDQVLESEKDSAALRELSLSEDTFYAIASAAEVDLFQGLHEPKSARELAENLGLNAGLLTSSVTLWLRGDT